MGLNRHLGSEASGNRRVWGNKGMGSGFSSSVCHKPDWEQSLTFWVWVCERRRRGGGRQWEVSCLQLDQAHALGIRNKSAEALSTLNSSCRLEEQPLFGLKSHKKYLKIPTPIPQTVPPHFIFATVKRSSWQRGVTNLAVSDRVFSGSSGSCLKLEPDPDWNKAMYLYFPCSCFY